MHFGLAEHFIKNDSDYGLIERDGRTWLGHGDNPQLPMDVLKLQGRHHYLNALAVLALCRPFDIKPEVFQKVFAEFSGLPHRTELVLIHNGVTWINDSKGTNVGATVTAIQSLGEQTPGQIILIAGGEGKEADFEELAPLVRRFCKKALLFGRDRHRIEQALQQAEVPLVCVEDLNSAVGYALEAAQAEDCVLFSPACASFDQFDNYIQRGEVFVDLVEKACGVHD